MLLIASYTVFLTLFAIFSYSQMDPNITFFNSSLWQLFREKMVYLGYYQREIASVLYIVGVVLLFVFHFLLVRSKAVKKPFKVALIVAGVLFLSYPFLSHDFFNYLFDAKIATFYHQNPYLKRALDFPQDPWTRFMHWTHRTYPYGPVFLVFSLVPSFLSFGKFIVAFFSFKLMFISFYLGSVYVLGRNDKELAIQFATHPLVLVEGLMNTHNDLIGTALVIMAAFYISQKKDILGRVLLLLSVGIKYVTLPFLFVSRREKLNKAVTVATVALMAYWIFYMEVQPWYFLLLIALMPYYKKVVSYLWIMFAGLLFSYYPYVRFGGWDKQWKVDIKHEIIWVFMALNLLYLLVIFSKKKFFSK